MPRRPVTGQSGAGGMTKRLSAEARRRSIVDAGTRLFAAKGFHGVSVDEIVRAVGVNPAVLYRHFSSKEALYETVLHELACTREDYLEAVLDTDGEFEEVLRSMTRIFVAGVAWQPSLLQMELHSLLDGSEANREFFENRWKTFTDFIEYSVREMAEENGLESVNPQVAGLLYQGMIREALLSKCLGRDDRFPDIEIDRLVDDLITLFLAALRRPPAPAPGP